MKPNDGSCLCNVVMYSCYSILDEELAYSVLLILVLKCI